MSYFLGRSQFWCQFKGSGGPRAFLVGVLFGIFCTFSSVFASLSGLGIHWQYVVPVQPLEPIFTYGFGGTTAQKWGVLRHYPNIWWWVALWARGDA